MDGNCNLMVTSQIHFHCTTMGTPNVVFLFVFATYRIFYIQPRTSASAGDLDCYGMNEKRKKSEYLFYFIFLSFCHF